MLVTALRTGADALRANPVRALLATLGVVIGAAALVAVLAVSDGVEQTARDAVGAMGYDLVTVQPVTMDTVDGTLVPRDSVAALAADDAAALARALDTGRTRASRVALRTVGMHVTALGVRPRRRVLQLEGLALGRAAASPDTLLAGRHLTPEETRTGAPVAVVALATARALRDTAGPPPARTDSAAGREPVVQVGGRRRARAATAHDTSGQLGVARAALGDSLRVGARWVRVVGVRRAVPDTGGVAAMLGAGLGVTVPYDVARAALPRGRGPFGGALAVLTVHAGRAEEVKAVRAGVEAWLAARDPRWRAQWRVRAGTEETLKSIRQAMLIFKLLVGSFTSITLLVGGIGIMNVLLASVAERTREIGIRKATGATRRDILLQFLAESVTITLAGSAIGTALGLAGAFGITALMRAFTDAPVYAAVTPTTLAIAIGMAVVVGLAFGCYPALRAARLAPIEAIHTE